MSVLVKRGDHKRDFSLRMAAGYLSPVVPIILLFGPISVLQGIYAKYFGISLTEIAAVIVIARCFDAAA